eukprot:jgi/Chrzof1/7068/Cz02g09170.t1
MVVPKKFKKITDMDDDDATTTSAGSLDENAPPGFPNNWSKLADLSVFELGKTTKPIITASNIPLMLYKFQGRVYCSDANSTAYKYPLTDAKVFNDGSTVVVEVPLDGSMYDLQTGAVLKWCPKDSLVRNVLGTLKSNQEPTPLKAYPTYVTSKGDIWVKLL